MLAEAEAARESETEAINKTLLAARSAIRFDLADGPLVVAARDVAIER